MSSHRKYEPDMTANALPATTARFPPELCHHWVKRLASLMDVPLETARHWAFRRLPDARRKEVALALIAECDHLEALIIETRRRWAEVANETGGAVARGAADPLRPLPGRVGEPRPEIILKE